jgi:cytochrome c oxidase assembly protein subunit 15
MPLRSVVITFPSLQSEDTTVAGGTPAATAGEMPTVWRKSLIPNASYNRKLHTFTLFTCGCTFVLLIAGALVTSNDAGLAVPDWPTSFGSIYRMPPMVGGVLFEHGHRMIAQFVGLLTIVLAIWMWRTDQRSWMRWLGVTALALVIFQGILGGTTVLNFLPPPVSAAHATLAQTFFVTLVLICVFTSRTWIDAPSKTSAVADARLRKLVTGILMALYLQLICGAAFRHVWTKLGPAGANRYPADEIVFSYLVPHVINAVIVMFLIILTAARVFRYHSQSRELRRPVLILLVLLGVQLLLGTGAYVARVHVSADAAQPLPLMIWTTVAHVAVGALTLAAAAVLALYTYRRPLAVPDRADIPENARQAATA